MDPIDLRIRARQPVRGDDGADGPPSDQCRCGCGAMLARVVAEGLEFKCRRCKTVVLITHDELVEMYRALGLTPPPVPPSR